MWGGERWVVRAYFEPLGRSETRYNFERFSSTGRVQAYVSLEGAAAAKAALTPQDVRVGPTAPTGSANSEANGTLSLNWYTGAAHGTVREYAKEPTYEQLRVDVMHWLASRAPGEVTGLAGRAAKQTGQRDK